MFSLVYEQYRNAADDHGAVDEEDAAEANDSGHGAVDEENAAEANDIVDDDGYLNTCLDPATVLAFHFFFRSTGRMPKVGSVKGKDV